MAFGVTLGAATIANAETGGAVALAALPTHAAGTLLIVPHHVKNDSSASTATSGWAELAAFDDGTLFMTVFYKWATSSSETPPTVDTTTFRRATIVYGLALTGAIGSGSPLDVAAGTNSGTPTGTGPWVMTAPTITTVTNGCAILRLFSSRDNNTQDTNSEGTKLAFGSGYNNPDGVGGSSMGSSWIEQATAGATGTATMNETVSGADAFIAMTLALLPAAGAAAAVPRATLGVLQATHRAGNF